MVLNQGRVCSPSTPWLPWKIFCRFYQVALVVKNLAANAGDIRDSGSIPGSWRSSEGRCGNPLQYSCLENPMDRGTWWATVHGVTKNQTILHWLITHTRFSRDNWKWQQHPALQFLKLSTNPHAMVGLCGKITPGYSQLAIQGSQGKSTSGDSWIICLNI